MYVEVEHFTIGCDLKLLLITVVRATFSEHSIYKAGI